MKAHSPFRLFRTCLAVTGALLTVLPLLRAERLGAGNGSAPRPVILPTPPPSFLFVVNSTDDHDDGICDGADCTLREAINAANAAIGTSDTIRFTVTGPINLTSALPSISDPVT